MMNWDEIQAEASILIVDDDPATVRMFEQMFRQAGYAHIFSTVDPAKALPLFRETHPDLVLLDLHMPPGNGLDLLGELYDEIPPSTFLPIVVITGDNSSEAKLNALLLGAKDFITKPIDMVETMLRIRIHLETRFQFVEMERALALSRGA
jgi:DNA-binding response OmpR family regulator